MSLGKKGEGFGRKPPPKTKKSEGVYCLDGGMMVTQTSLLSFLTLKDEGVLGKRQAQIYTYISLHPKCSDRQIAKDLALPINCVTGRRNELAKMGMIRNEGLVFDEETNRLAMRWLLIV